MVRDLGRVLIKAAGDPRDVRFRVNFGHCTALRELRRSARRGHNRDLVAAIMTPAQIAEAQRLAQEWKPE